MKAYMMIVLVLSLGVMSCQKNSEDSTGAKQRAGRTINPNAPGSSAGGLPSVNLAGQTAGRVFTDTRYAAEFNGAIRALVSASMDEEDLGFVSPINGVKLKGFVEIDESGRLVPGNSLIELEIVDEFVGQVIDQVTIPSVKIQVPAYEGYAHNGQFQIRFADDYGWIQIQGTYQNGGRSRGFLSFMNANGRSGEGLSFEIDTCGFFSCQ